MPTDDEHPSAAHTLAFSRDTPPHLDDRPVPKAVGFEISEALKAVERPLEDISEDARIFEYETEELAGLFAPRACVKLESKIRMMAAIKIGNDYLQRPTIKKGFEITRSDFKRPLLVKTLEAMEETVRKFRVINLNEEFLGAAPEPGRLAWTTKLLIQIRMDYQYELLADGS